MNRLSKFLLSAALVLLLILIVTGSRQRRGLFRIDGPDPYLKLFSEVLTLVNKEYVDPLDLGEITSGAFNGLLSSLDRVSAYLPPDYLALYKLRQAGQAMDTGIRGLKRGNSFQITWLQPGSPAEAAGLKRGDLIRPAADEPDFALSRWTMQLSMFSEREEELEFLVIPGGGAGRRLVRVRAMAPGPSALVASPEPNQFQVSLRRIDNQAVETLRQELPGAGPFSLLLDLRGCQDGDPQALFSLGRLLLPVPLQLELREKKETRQLLLGGGNPLSRPTLVLIDQSTLLEGELLAALLQQAGALVIGRPSLGIVAARGLLEFPAGDGVILADGFYWLAGKELHARGLKPDRVLSEKEMLKVPARLGELLAGD